MGVTFDDTEKKFVFDFEHDGAEDKGLSIRKAVDTAHKQIDLYKNVLVIDDITTSGSTLNEVLRTLRILNKDNEITIFSIIGRKDVLQRKKMKP